MLCHHCGQIEGIESYDASLWDLYSRLDDSCSRRPGLSFSADWLSENVTDDDDYAAVNLAMERDMGDRGLCVSCGRPDLRGVTPEMILSEYDAREIEAMGIDIRSDDKDNQVSEGW